MKIYVELTANTVDSPIRVSSAGSKDGVAGDNFSIVNKDGHFLDLSYDALRALGNGWHDIPDKILDRDDVWEGALERGIEKATRSPKE